MSGPATESGTRYQRVLFELWQKSIIPPILNDC